MNDSKKKLSLHKIASAYKPTWTTTNLGVLMEFTLNYDPYYQRGEVWDNEYRVKLIHSIINNIPVNAIHLVKETNEDDGGETYIVLDGKQRLSAIRDFLGDKFGVKISFKDGSEEECTYSKLKNISKDVRDSRSAYAKKIVLDIKQFSIACVMWPNLSLLDQSAIFDTINMSKELSRDERFLAKFYYAKILAKFFMRQYFSSINTKIVTENMRSRSLDLIWSLRFLYVMLDGADGVGLEDTKNLSPNMDRICKMVGTSSRGAFDKFVKDLHNKIATYINDRESQGKLAANFESDTEMQQMLESFGWTTYFKENTKILDKMCNEVIPIKSWGRSSAWLFLYFSTFILQKYNENIITQNSFSCDIVKYKELYSKYILWIDEDRDARTRRLHQKLTYGEHCSKLEELFKNIGVDIGKKYPAISASQKTIALVKANGICEICNAMLTEANVSFDHVKPASLHSSGGNVKAICVDCNRRKQDNDISSITKIHTYIEKSI